MPTTSGTDVKREIMQIKLRGIEREALLSGFVRSCMSLSISRGKGVLLGLDCRTEFVREYIATLMLNRFKVRPKSTESTLMYADCNSLLRLLGILRGDGFELYDGVPEAYARASSAYVRGVFLGCGSFSAHEADGSEGATAGGGYHLEFSVISESYADALAELLAKSDISLRKAARAEKTVLYAKDSETVCNCLAYMRLDKLVLKLNDTVTTLSFKRDVNRRINCELANMTRTAHAAVDVTEAIDAIERAVGLDALPPKLLEAAEARRNSPDSSLAALAYELGISKSGLKHRYDRIIEIAQAMGS